MTPQQFNQIFSNLQNLDQRYTRVASSLTDDFYREKNQGEEGIKTEIFDLGGGEFLKVTSHSNSYGDNEYISSLQLVQPISKTVTDYENL